MLELNEIRVFLKTVLKKEEISKNVYFVGGCVRDYLRGKKPSDIDIVVNQEDGSKILCLILHNFFKKESTYPFQLGSYPIYSITFLDDVSIFGNKYNTKGMTLEVAETMKEEFSDPNTRQRNVFYTSDLSEDVFRRDFSVNSGLMNLDGELIEISKTFKEDIKNGIIRCNNGVDKDKIFSDDPLRCIRAATFSSRFDWEIEEKTADAIRRNAERVKIVAIERIMKEITKVVDIPFGMYRLIINLEKLNLLKYVFPYIEDQKNVYQQPDIRNIHMEGETVYKHTLSALRNASTGLIPCLATLLHDVGKTNQVAEYKDGKCSFKAHEKIGAEMSIKILSDLRFSKSVIDSVSHLIKHHMDFSNFNLMTEKAIRKNIREIGEENIENLFSVINADSLGTIVKLKDGTIGSIFDHKDMFVKIRELIEKDKKVKNINLFNGNELMQILNITQGKDVGIAYSIMLEVQYEFGYGVDKDFAKKIIIDKFLNRK